MSDEKRVPVVRKAAFTFDLVGQCIYCEKTCRRQRTYYASSTEEASAQADASMAHLCHKKCGGY